MIKIVFTIISVIFLSSGVLAQNIPVDTNYLKVEKQLKDLKTLRTKDSLRIDILTKEIKTLIKATSFENNETESKIDSSKIKQQLAEIDRIKASTQGVPVILNNDTLFKIYADLGPYTPIDRAQTTEKKINFLYEKPFFIQDSLKIKNTYNSLIVSYEDDIVLGISEIDALWEGMSIEELAQSHRDKIANKIIQFRKENSFKNKIIRVSELLLIIAAIISAIYFINFLFNKAISFLLNKTSFFNKGLKFKNYEVFKREQLETFLNKTLYFLKFLVIVIILFSTVPFALKIFPATSIWANEFQEIIFEPLKSLGDSLIGYLPKLIKIFFILFVARYTLRMFKYFAFEIERGSLNIKGFYKEWAKPTYLILRSLFIIFLLIIIFPYLPGSGTIAFQGVSVFLGILISIGSSSAISNAIAGIVITYMRPFQPNDWIKTGDIIGIVIEKNALVTRLKTINNEDVTVPNSAILSGATVNYSSLGREDGLVITTKIKVRYDYNEREISKLLISAANKTSGITNRLTPYVFQVSLNEINATYEINAITFQPQNMYFIKSDLVKNIHNLFKEANISLNSVQFVDIKANQKIE